MIGGEFDGAGFRAGALIGYGANARVVDTLAGGGSARDQNGSGGENQVAAGDPRKCSV